MTKVFQIYFEESQKAQLEPEYIPYLNNDCTIFFENSVIRNLVNLGEHKDCDYFGVVSYKLRSKLGYTKAWRSHPNIANHSTSEFTPELFQIELDKHKPDVMSFQCHVPHDPISYADTFHPKLSEYFKEIMRKIGYNWEPKIYENVFYCNYFVAKPEIYEKYVKEMLIPAINEMLFMPELWQNSQYPATLPLALQQKFKVPFYTYHTFILERAFSFFADLHNLNCKHY